MSIRWRGPGEADLTTHVCFETLARIAHDGKLAIDILTTQAQFLNELGIRPMAANLKQHATPEQAEAIDKALERLTDDAPRAMGSLFKVLAVSAPKCRDAEVCPRSRQNSRLVVNRLVLVMVVMVRRLLASAVMYAVMAVDHAVGTHDLGHRYGLDVQGADTGRRIQAGLALHGKRL